MKYSSYKFSGADWLGEIPSDWKVCPLKYIFTIKKRIAGEPGHTVLSITQSGIKPKDMSGQGQFAQDYSNYQLVYPGDFAMNHMDLLTGWVDLSKYEGVTSPDYRVFINNDDTTYLSEYYKYIFQYCYSGRVFYGLGQGVSGFGRWRLPAEMFLNFRLPVPPKSTQETIVQYLNRKVAHIDSVIAEAKASIEEYKAWKASVIYEAVTKGLDPDMEMKDSGVEWIGEIPSDWDVMRLKNVIFFIESGVSVNAAQTPANEGSTGVLKTSSVSKYTFIPEENKEVNAEELGRVSCPVKANTIIVSRMNTPELVGACGFVERDWPNLFLPDRLWQVHFIETVNVKYVWYYLCSNYIRSYYASLSSGTSSSMQNISQGQFENAYLMLPPYAVQKELVDYLDSRCSAIDSLVSEKESLIADLESYKKSLIFEVVTGKRKVV